MTGLDNIKRSLVYCIVCIWKGLPQIWYGQ